MTAKDISKSKPAWDKLTNTEREKYRDRAKRLNVRVSSTKIRYNSLGQSVTEHEMEEIRIEEEKNKRRNEIEQMLRDAADICELDTKIFYFVSATCFFESPKNIYPAEIAFAKFSLQDGIFDSMSFEINPGILEVGSAYDAQVIADETHKYPLPDESTVIGESDYMKIVMKILDFLPQDSDLPIFFTEGFDEIPAEAKTLKSTQRVMTHIFEKAQEYDVARSLRIYSIIELLYYFKETTSNILNEQNCDSSEKSFRSFHEALSKFKLTNAEYKYSAPACMYHENLDVIPHCAFSKCVRLGYIISKWCSQGSKYLLKPGFHFPKGMESIER